MSTTKKIIALGTGIQKLKKSETEFNLQILRTNRRYRKACTSLYPELKGYKIYLDPSTGVEIPESIPSVEVEIDLEAANEEYQRILAIKEAKPIKIKK